MNVIDFISRLVHVSTAIALVGGSVFTLWVLMPAAKQLPVDAHDTLAKAVQARWKRFVHIGILLFLASGIYNYLQARGNHDGDSLYHALLGTKMLLALFIFFVASALVGRSKGLAGIREKRETWLKVLVLAAAIVIGISSFVKVRGKPAPQPAVVEPATAE